MINTDIKDIETVNAATNNENKPRFKNGTWDCEINKIETLITQKSQKDAIKIQFKGVSEDVKDALCNMWITRREDGEKGAFYFEQDLQRLYVIARDYFGISEEKLRDEAETNWDLVSNIVGEISKALNKKKKMTQTIPVKYYKEDVEGSFAQVTWFPTEEAVDEE